MEKEQTIETAPRPTASWPGVGLFCIAAIGALTIAQGLFVPIFLAILLALILSPVRRGLGRLGFSPPAAAVVILLVLAATVGLLFYFLSGTVIHLVDNAPGIADKIKVRMETITGSIEPVMKAGDKIEQITAGANNEQSVTVREPGFMSLMAHTTPVALGQALISLTLAFFLVASGDMFYEKLVQAMPTLKDKQRALTIARDIENQLSTYLLTVTLINIGFGVVVGFAMWWLGLPNPVLIAIAAFLLNYLPYIGTIGGMILTFVIGAVTYDQGAVAVLPPLAYWIANTIEGQLVTPILVGRRLQLNAVVVFTSFALWSWLWGIMGMFLATPLLLTLKVVSDRISGLNTLGRFLGTRDPVSGADRRIVLFMFGKAQQRRDRHAAHKAPDEDPADAEDSTPEAA